MDWLTQKIFAALGRMLHLGSRSTKSSTLRDTSASPANNSDSTQGEDRARQKTRLSRRTPCARHKLDPLDDLFPCQMSGALWSGGAPFCLPCNRSEFYGTPRAAVLPVPLRRSRPPRDLKIRVNGDVIVETGSAMLEDRGRMFSETPQEILISRPVRSGTMMRCLPPLAE